MVLTYGLIETGGRGWSAAVRLTTIVAGVVILGGFFFWERRLGIRGGRPLVPPALFRSKAFTWAPSSAAWRVCAWPELTVERSGIGSAVVQTFQKTGAPLGSAIMGSVVVTSYQAHLGTAGLPAATEIRKSVYSGIAAAGIVLTLVFVSSRLNAVEQVEAATVEGTHAGTG